MVIESMRVWKCLLESSGWRHRSSPQKEGDFPRRRRRSQAKQQANLLNCRSSFKMTLNMFKGERLCPIVDQQWNTSHGIAEGKWRGRHRQRPRVKQAKGKRQSHTWKVVKYVCKLNWIQERWQWVGGEVSKSVRGCILENQMPESGL